MPTRAHGRTDRRTTRKHSVSGRIYWTHGGNKVDLPNALNWGPGGRLAAYRRVYDSRHLQADCQEPGSAPEPYAR